MGLQEYAVNNQFELRNSSEFSSLDISPNLNGPSRTTSNNRPTMDPQMRREQAELLQKKAQLEEENRRNAARLKNLQDTQAQLK